MNVLYHLLPLARDSTLTERYYPCLVVLHPPGGITVPEVLHPPGGITHTWRYYPCLKVCSPGRNDKLYLALCVYLFRSISQKAFIKLKKKNQFCFSYAHILILCKNDVDLDKRMI